MPMIRASLRIYFIAILYVKVNNGLDFLKLKYPARDEIAFRSRDPARADLAASRDRRPPGERGAGGTFCDRTSIRASLFSGCARLTEQKLQRMPPLLLSGARCATGLTPLTLRYVGVTCWAIVSFGLAGLKQIK